MEGRRNSEADGAGLLPFCTECGTRKKENEPNCVCGHAFPIVLTPVPDDSERASAGKGRVSEVSQTAIVNEKEAISDSGTSFQEVEQTHAPQMSSKPPEKDPLKTTAPKMKRKIRGPFDLLLIIVVSLSVVAVIIYYAVIEPYGEGPKEVNPNTSTSAPINQVPPKPDDKPVKKPETAQEGTTQLCSEYARIWKECYIKASNGILPAQGIKDITSQRLSSASIEISCREGFMEHSRLGDVSPTEINKMTAAQFSGCFTTLDSNDTAFTCIKNAYVAAQVYFSNDPQGIVTLKKLEDSGYKPLSDVPTSITNGTLKNLTISAKHKDGSLTYFVNAAGDITHE